MDLPKWCRVGQFVMLVGHSKRRAEIININKYIDCMSHYKPCLDDIWHCKYDVFIRNYLPIIEVPLTAQDILEMMMYKPFVIKRKNENQYHIISGVWVDNERCFVDGKVYDIDTLNTKWTYDNGSPLTKWRPMTEEEIDKLED